MPQRYAYPEFSTEQTPDQIYYSIWDEELKAYLRNPDRSKFRDCGLVMDEKARIARFKEILNEIGYALPPVSLCDPARNRTRSLILEAYFRATFDTWTNYARSGQETHWVGYSPPIVFDADKLFSDFPSNGKMIHIVRNPWSGYSDTKKRPFPMNLTKYCQVWNACQTQAEVYETKYKGRFLAIRAEDLITHTKRTTEEICSFIGVPWNESMMRPSFNGKAMESVYPWGTIKKATPEVNQATARELSRDEALAVAIETIAVLPRWYTDEETLRFNPYAAE